MTIIAKYAATCPTCSRPIAPGHKIEWAKGTQARHAACAAAAPSIKAPRTYGQRIEASRAQTAARRGWGSGHGQAGRMPGYSSYCTDSASCRCYDCQ